MKKKFSGLLIFVLMLTFILTACNYNNSASKETETASKPAEKQVELIISAAASLTDAAKEIATTFKKEYPNITITYNFGASGSLSQQIEQGAPADLFLTASKKDMDALAEKGLINKDSRIDFASNDMVVVTGKSNKLTLSNFKDISNLNVNNIVLGNPKAVPAGRYGKESLENAGAWDKIKNKVVYASDVRQVLAQVESGNADLAFVYNSDALQSKDVKIVTKVDSSLHSPIIYPGAIIKSSKNQDAAKLYLDFLNSEKGKSILKSYGFIVN